MTDNRVLNNRPPSINDVETGSSICPDFGMDCCYCLPDDPACGEPVSLPFHMASSSISSAGSAHKSNGANVVSMQYGSAVEEMVCIVCVDVTEVA